MEFRLPRGFLTYRASNVVIIRMTTRFFYTFAALFLFHFSAHSAIKLDAIRGASNYDITTSPFQIMGGTGGDASLCSHASTEDGCNSCVADLIACNYNRIFAERILRITFSSDSITDGTVYTAYARASSSSGAGDINGIVTSTVSSKNQIGTVYFPWGQVCEAIQTSGSSSGTGTTACEDGSLSGSITVGFIQGTGFASGAAFADSMEIKVRVDTPNPNMILDRDEIDDCASAVSGQQIGICHFELYPGDDKAFVDNLEPFGSFPTVGVMRVKYLRFYYSTIGFADVTAASSYTDIELNTSSTSGSTAVETLSNKLGGLTNEQIYYVRIATVDEAGNIADFTSDANIIANCGSLTPADPSVCVYMVQPSAVLGLLPKTFNCFIASASYGSPMEQHVELFRKFRGEVLMKSAVGRYVSRLYYKYGPYPALFIMKHPSLKPVARVMLWPAWAVAWVSLNIGVWAGLLLSFLPLMAGILIFKISRKKSHAMVTTV